MSDMSVRVAAVVLAAGGAKRFGRLKQLLPWQGGTLLTQVVDTALASSARPVVVVVGAQAEDCRAALRGRPVQVVVNPEWAQGQSTSVQAGLAALPPDIDAALFLLADQPAVQSSTLEQLIACYDATRAPLVWPEWNGRRGNPVLFDRRLFPELMALRGDVGARLVLQAHAAEAERVPVSDAGILLDIDTPNDYEKLASRHGGC
ncbi:MAG: molybdenum cofactor cytidylyltransferase [Anaerolineae bacterium]|nr:molybdenum cofactor cytidylyltransferase [Anaerolineae bacterium]MDW8069925.1 molybdenum cofactor cytidylyltransferase [Anaerolineae bacterium]